MKKNNFTTTASRIVSRTPNFNRYLKDIYKIPLLSPEEEPVLFQKARKGDMAAFERIINSNLRFVVEVAKNIKINF